MRNSQRIVLFLTLLVIVVLSGFVLYAQDEAVDVASLPACGAGLDAVRALDPAPPPDPTEESEAPAATEEPADVTPTVPPPTPTLPPAPSVNNIPFPENYRENYKLLFVFDRPNSQQVRAICGNNIAASTAPGEAFPYGSLLVMEVWITRKDDSGVALTDENGHYIRDRMFGAFMQLKEEGFGVDYADDRSGEWEYIAYRPDGDVAIPPERTNACAACHLRQAGEEVDFVFRMDLLYEGEDALTPPGTDNNTVALHIYAFHPQQLTVETGTTVTWVNYDQAIHGIASEGLFESEALDTILINPDGDSFSFTFDTAGTYEYASTTNRGMSGVIEVVDP